MSAALYLCLHLRDFASQAVMRAHPELRHQSLAILSGTPPLEFVFGVNRRARREGVEPGMTRVQAESFPGTTILRRDHTQEERAFAELSSIADQFSPRVETVAQPEELSSGATMFLDIANSNRLLGTADQIAEALLRKVCATGYDASVAVSRNANAALLAARGFEGIIVIEPGSEAQTLSPLPLTVLNLDSAQRQTVASWGVHTLGQLAALPLRSLVARIGQDGQRLHRLAHGTYDHLLVPRETAITAPVVERMEWEHPIESLEPLLFLISRALEQVMKRAAQRAMVIAAVETCLVLDDAEHSEHCRTVRPALPERDHPTLLKLIHLDLELHPPRAAVTALNLRVHPAPPKNVQQGLFAPQSPEAGRLEVLLARLRKLVGEERVGVAELRDSHAPDSFCVVPFDAQSADACLRTESQLCPYAVLRIVRPPVAVHMQMEGMSPTILFRKGKRFSIGRYSGPWRTNGSWWTSTAWDCEEWDVMLLEEPQQCLRLAFDSGANAWYLIGIYD
jgi:protein ImuB